MNINDSKDDLEKDMGIYQYGPEDAETVLIQMVDDHDMEVIENEVKCIRELAGTDFRLIAFKVQDWNRDLSPWEADPVFGNEPFGCGAKASLDKVLKRCTDRGKTYYIGGYSLAGLFALWSAYQTDIVKGVAAASPSMWFPGFVDYMKEHQIHCDSVYLSLGDKEAKTKNPVMSTVRRRIDESESVLLEQGIDVFFEENHGNHFKEPDIRTAKAFAYCMSPLKG